MFVFFMYKTPIEAIKHKMIFERMIKVCYNKYILKLKKFLSQILSSEE